MTTQVLISEPEVLSQSLAKSAQATAITGLVSQKRPILLQYQANHQVELLHLQAETEVLLQHLRALKQRKTATVL